MFSCFWIQEKKSNQINSLCKSVLEQAPKLCNVVNSAQDSVHYTLARCLDLDTTGGFYLANMMMSSQSSFIQSPTV